MKLGPVTKLEKRNKIMSQQLKIPSCQQSMTSLSFLQFMANLELSESRILDGESVKLTFSLIVTSYLTKTENRTNKSLAQLLHYCFELKHYFYQKMPIFWKKNSDISKIKRALARKGIFSKTTYVCTYVSNFKFLA